MRERRAERDSYGIVHRNYSQNGIYGLTACGEPNRYSGQQFPFQTVDDHTPLTCIPCAAKELG